MPRAAFALAGAAALPFSCRVPRARGVAPRRRARPAAVAPARSAPVRACAPSLAAAVEGALRRAGADAAADAAYVLLANSGARAPPKGWEEMLEALGDAGVRGEDLSRVVARAGVEYVLALDAKEARAVLRLLEEDLGFSEAQVVRVVSQRPALMASVAAVRERMDMLRDLCFSDRDVRHVATKWPGLLGVDAVRAKAVIDYLCREDVGFTRASLRSLVRRAPWLLVYDVEKHVAPALNWLTEKFLVDAPGVSLEHLIRASPHVLGMSPAGMAAVVEFLHGLPLFEQRTVVSVVRQFPPILTSSVEDSLQPAVEFLTAELFLGDEDLWRIVRAFPATLVLDVRKEMRRNVDYLRSRGVGNVSRIVARLPPVLSYDVETNLAPKLDYLESGLGLSAFDILQFPGYFSYSLTEVIEPRTRFLQKCGIPVTQSGLNMALAPTDEAFCHRVAFAPFEDYVIFRLQLQEKRAQLTNNAKSSATPGSLFNTLPMLTGESTSSVTAAAVASGAMPSPAATRAAIPINDRPFGSIRIAGQRESSGGFRDKRARQRSFAELERRPSKEEGGELNDVEGEDPVESKKAVARRQRRSSALSGSAPVDEEEDGYDSSLGSLPFEHSLVEARAAEEREAVKASETVSGDGGGVDDEGVRLLRRSRPAPLPPSLLPLNPPRQRRRKRRLRATDARLPWSTEVPLMSARRKQYSSLNGDDEIAAAGGNNDKDANLDDVKRE